MTSDFRAHRRAGKIANFGYLNIKGQAADLLFEVRRQILEERLKYSLNKLEEMAAMADDALFDHVVASKPSLEGTLPYTSFVSTVRRIIARRMEVTHIRLAVVSLAASKAAL